MSYFVVVSHQGPAWDPEIPMRQQEGWDDHADYMNGITENGPVVLGGLLGVDGSFDGEHRAMLVVAAESEKDVRSILADDPWSEGKLGKLKIESINSWEILLGELPSS